MRKIQQQQQQQQPNKNKVVHLLFINLPV